LVHGTKTGKTAFFTQKQHYSTSRYMISMACSILHRITIRPHREPECGKMDFQVDPWNARLSTDNGGRCNEASFRTKHFRTNFYPRVSNKFPLLRYSLSTSKNIQIVIYLHICRHYIRLTYPTLPNICWISSKHCEGILHLTPCGGCQEGPNKFCIFSNFVDILTVGNLAVHIYLNTARGKGRDTVETV
jgi:hypothetical protein